MTILLAVIAALSSFLALFFHKKNQVNTALVENQQATKELNTLDQTLAKNKGLLEAEELKRQTYTDETYEQQLGTGNVSKEDLVDFVNKLHKP